MGIACLLVLAFIYLIQLGCWSNVNVWARRWEPYVIILFFCCCPWCLTAAAPTLTGAGVLYTLMQLADTDVKSEASPLRPTLTWDAFRFEFQALLACRGANVYCLGPVALHA